MLPSDPDCIPYTGTVLLSLPQMLGVRLHGLWLIVVMVAVFGASVGSVGAEEEHLHCGQSLFNKNQQEPHTELGGSNLDRSDHHTSDHVHEKRNLLVSTHPQQYENLDTSFLPVLEAAEHGLTQPFRYVTASI